MDRKENSSDLYVQCSGPTNCMAHEYYVICNSFLLGISFFLEEQRQWQINSES